MSTKQRRIAETVRKYPGESLKSVGGPPVRHHMDARWMYRAYELTRKDDADDAIIGCKKKEDVGRTMKVLALRFAKYSSDHTPRKDEAGRLHQTR